MTTIPNLPCLSIRQPWAYMIINHDIGKDVENRTWPTRIRGRILIHASKGMTKGEYWDAWEFYQEEVVGQIVALPEIAEIHRGGIVGSVEIVDCVTESTSPWFCGPYGFVLRDPQILPFTPCRGALSFFKAILPTH